MLRKYISILGISLLAMGSFGQLTSPQVLAATPSTDMYPGQVKQFTAQYKNDGDVDLMKDAILKVFVGTELEVLPTTIKDQFNGGSIYPVNSTVISNNSTKWGTVISYQPKSANDANNPSGLNTPGDVTIPVGQIGKLTFQARLKSDILTRVNPDTNQNFKVGDVLDPLSENSSQGVSSILQFTGRASIPGNIGVKIVESPEPQEPQEPIPSNLAKPDANATTGGGFDLSKPQPIHTNMTFNPNPGIVGKSLEVTTTGLLDSVTSEPLNSSPCTTYLQGQNGYNKSVSGTVVNGICKVTFGATDTPTNIGIYKAVTKAMGPNGELFTKPYDIQFILGQTTLPRSGGIGFLAGAATLAGLVGATVYAVTRKKRLRVE